MYTISIISRDDDVIREIISSLDPGRFRVLSTYENINSISTACIIDRSHIDIIIFDVSQINNILMIQELKQYYPMAKYVIVDRSMKFNLLTQLLNVGINGFLQKPIVRSEIDCVINSIVKQLDYEYQTKLLEPIHRIPQSEMECITDENRLNFIMHSKNNISIDNDELKTIDIENEDKFLLILIDTDFFRSHNMGITYDNIQTIRKSIINFVNTTSLRSKKLIVRNQRSIEQMFILLAHNQEHILRTEALELANKLLLDHQQSSVNIDITIAVSDVHAVITNRLYKQVRIALDLRLIHGANNIYEYDDDLVVNCAIGYPENQFSLLNKCMSEKKYDDIYFVLKRIIYGEGLSCVSPAHVRFMYFQVINLILKLYKDQTVNIEQVIGLDVFSGEVLNHLKSRDEVVKTLFKCIKNCLETYYPYSLED